MVTDVETVLVLGAGASCSFGCPPVTAPEFYDGTTPSPLCRGRNGRIRPKTPTFRAKSPKINVNNLAVNIQERR
jgi:hypothetical protein